MKYSNRLSDAMHILAYVEIVAAGDLSSQAIADSLVSNPSLVRRLMAQMVKAKLLVTRPGVVAPKLARPAETITLLDVYNAVDEQASLLHVDHVTNQECPIGGTIQATLNDAYAKVQMAAEQQMAAITLQAIIDDIIERNQNKHLIFKTI